jgi:CheY-like chemotaxis protein
LARARILIIDDDSDFAAIVKTALESRGYEAIACGAPDECERLIRELSPDLLILDLMMGGRMEGALIARRLKGNGDVSGGRRIPILMLTGVRRQTGFFWLGDPRHPVYLPVDEVMEKPVKPAELAQKVELLLARCAGLPSGPRRTLVVIDDNPALRGACMEVLLRVREYVVAAAQDGPSGLELVERYRPDAVLVDLLMPGMDGTEVIRRIQDAYPGLPVIGITGDGLAASAAEKTLRGRIRWLFKPFTPVELREAVRRAIEEPEGIA